MTTPESSWYSVRCVLRAATAEPWGPADLGPGEAAYEERITLWRADSADEAIRRAEEEAETYGRRIGAERLGIAQSYRLSDEPGEGAEVFSLLRRSALADDPYLDAHFDTGAEFEPDGAA